MADNKKYKIKFTPKEYDEFGKMYNALPGAIKSGFTSMGCTEYEIATNEPIQNSNRMVVIDSEISTTVPKDCVIRTVQSGMELQGNMIRLAQVVSSLGNTVEETTSDGTTTEPSSE